MSKTIIPEGYEGALSVYDMQRAIEYVKTAFPRQLGSALNLKRVSAPLFVSRNSGLNDNLNGVERPVDFDVRAIEGDSVYEVVHSLAKWKRLALKRYDFYEGKGLYTDMNAIRRDEDVLDNFHSVYVDQWDWEKVITREQRTTAFLKDTVRRIVSSICNTGDELSWEFPQIKKPNLSRDVVFVTTQELEDMYPDLTPKERENAITKKYRTVFIMQIGGRLKSGERHDGRAPDYDDWDLNGDIFFYNDLLDCAMEISSMGIRVDEESLVRQLEIAGCPERANLPYHKLLLNGELPLTIGGGIGQSRICMLLMNCCHIGEVQASVWDEETLNACSEAGIRLL